MKKPSVGEMVLNRFLVGCGLASAFVVLAFLVQIRLGEIDSDGSYAIAVAIILLAAAVSINPKWRPGASAGVGYSLATMAWTVALFADFRTSENVRTTIAMTLATCILGIAFLIMFRPLALRQQEALDEQDEVDRDERLRVIFRQEFEAIREDFRRDHREASSCTCAENVPRSTDR